MAFRDRFGRTFARSEDGGSTVEFVIWMPFVVGCLMLILDFSNLMIVDAGLWNASRDTARAVALRRVSEADAEAHFDARMFPRKVPYTFDVTVDGDEVSVTVLVEGEETALTPFLRRVYDGKLGASVRMLMEPA
ncbi:hypothetical protein ATO8_01800 [Roseivivax marinus]|uniref:TadE-like domain-containing protein n=1 Tax=Roseivivax marinus TaxID=1379903 RepID=W4HR60_9RHOB|nr:TadE/TadG family type IV pilus assembly protein [Roseivivax marinus]ETW14601.1 hypothetical protein ATO8_01800 [Roseivivax marinus]